MKRKIAIDEWPHLMYATLNGKKIQIIVYQNDLTNAVDERYRYWVLFQDDVRGQVYGNYMIDYIDGTPSQVDMLWIEKRYRHKGFGRAFLQHAIEEFNLTFIDVLEGNTPAQRLYDSLGFKEIGRDKLENGSIMIRLKRGK